MGLNQHLSLHTSVQIAAIPKKKKGIMAFLSVLRITLNTNTHTLTHTKKYGILRKTNNINNQKSTALDCVRHKMLPYHSLCGGKSYYLALIQTLTDFKDNIPKECLSCYLLYYQRYQQISFILRKSSSQMEVFRIKNTHTHTHIQMFVSLLSKTRRKIT